VTSSGATARLIRLHIVPLLIPLLFAFKAARLLMFRRVSQTAIAYRGSSLSVGWTESLEGGDRLPWVQHADGEKDNFEPLTSRDWQLHIYGEATKEMRAMCETRKLPLRVFPWRAEMRQTGLWRNAAYLIRPDGYVGLADSVASTAAVTAYLDAHGIVPAH
jgi:hypothetical protein